jgi:hypothetical protein
VSLLKFLKPDDWRRGYALVILWAYGYQLVVWPIWFNATVILSAIFDVSIPSPIIVPWEQLIAGTTTLASIGAIHAIREKNTQQAALAPSEAPP